MPLHHAALRVLSRVEKAGIESVLEAGLVLRSSPFNDLLTNDGIFFANIRMETKE